MKQKYNRCAAFDVGSQKVFLAMEGQMGYKSFGTTTADFEDASQFLLENRIQAVCMEATGVYWMGLYDVLERHGLKVTLVKAGDAKNLPGRDKTDGEDCQWICKLFSLGLLRPSVIPTDHIRQLRIYMRLRSDHISMAGQHKQHIQKALIMMNVRLPEAISNITGQSGIKMIEAILGGERDPNQLLELCHTSIKFKKAEEIRKALTGIYKDEYLFVLKQAYECWSFYQKQIQLCDDQISSWIDKSLPPDQPLLKNKKMKRARGANKINIPDFEQKLLLLYGNRDVTRLPGLGCNNALELMAELGTDLSKWPNAKQFVNYLGLCGQKVYSGKMRKQKRRKMPNAGQIFREAAQTLLKSTHIGLGTFARRLRSRKGPYIAIKATARKLAIMYYNIVSKGIEYVEAGTEAYQRQLQETELKRLTKLAFKHNLSLTPLSVHQ